MPGLATPLQQLQLAVTAGAADWVNAVAWNPDRQRVHAAIADGSILTVEAVDGHAVEHARHSGPATCLAIAPDGTIASGGQDGALTVAGRPVKLGGGWVAEVAWRPDGGRLAAAHGRQIHLLDPDGTPNAVCTPFDATVSCVAWHPRGVNIAAGSYGGVRLLRARDGHPDTSLCWKGSVLAMAISPDGRRLAHGNQDATVHFWEIAKRRELHMWGYATKVRELAWRHDGRYLATGGGTSVTVWDFSGTGPENSTPLQLDHHDGLVNWLGFQPAGSLLASGGEDGLLVIWAPGVGPKPVAEIALDAPITCAAWSADGHALVAGTADGTIAICTLEPAR